MAAGLACGLVGCKVKDHTNPTVTIERAVVSDSGAELELLVENRSAVDARLERVNWEVSLGLLPLGSGTWEVENGELPAGTKGSKHLADDESGSVLRLRETAEFDTPPLDPDAAEIEIVGELVFGENDEEMGFGVTPFVATAEVEPE
ncbi:MAG: hypothetical protein AAF108_06055 [Planctomycetota bacterium]